MNDDGEILIDILAHWRDIDAKLDHATGLDELTPMTLPLLKELIAREEAQ